jgi:hypothetical protein
MKWIVYLGWLVGFAALINAALELGGHYHLLDGIMHWASAAMLLVMTFFSHVTLKVEEQDRRRTSNGAD